jgi:hypothetical protein
MSTENIKIEDILINDSRFLLGDYLFEPDVELSCHINSFGTLGILYPVIVYKDDKSQFHLIDGKKRVQFAKEKRETLILATVLSQSTPITDIITLIFCNKRHEIESSVVNKIQFICFTSSLNAPISWILQSLCIPFEFKPYGDFLNECEQINNLPKELKLFCHEKKFSLKQMLNLTWYPVDILRQIIKWKSVLQLTASTMDEIASNLKDYLRLNNKKIIDFIRESEVREILDSSLSPRDKTERFRWFLYIKRFPTLSDVNERIEETVKRLNLPGGIRINWDKTLENKNVNISINIKDHKQWDVLLNRIKSEEIKKAVKSILDNL